MLCLTGAFLVNTSTLSEIKIWKNDNFEKKNNKIREINIKAINKDENFAGKGKL